MIKSVDQYLSDRGIPPGDKRILLLYLHARAQLGEISPATERSMATYFVMLQKKTGSLDKITTDKLLEALYQFRKELSPSSFDRMRAIVLTFSKWLVKEQGNKNIDLETIRAVKKSKDNQTKLKPSDMLKWDDINKMVECAGSVRDKALILLFFESALRPAELCNLKWRDLHFTDAGVVVTTGRKTGRERRILCIKSEPWLKTHRELSTKIETDDWVFPSLTQGRKENLPIGIWGLSPIIKKTARAAGLERVYPYLMRHSRITALVEANMQETALKSVAWGNLDTGMLSRYVHLSGVAVDNAIRQTYGDVPEEKKPDIATSPVCPICGETGRVGAKFCGVCGASYDGSVPASKLEIMQENEQLKNRLNEMEKRISAFEKEAEKHLEKALQQLVAATVAARANTE
jgi:integrase